MQTKHRNFILFSLLIAILVITGCNADASAGLFRQISESTTPRGELNTGKYWESQALISISLLLMASILQMETHQHRLRRIRKRVVIWLLIWITQKIGSCF